jgi:nitroreductase
MELVDAVRGRRMVRAYDGRPVPADVLDRVLDLAIRVPSAGNTQGLDLVVLEGAQTSRYWDVTLPEPRRAAFAWPGLLRAPVLVIPVGDPGAYVRRYAEPDKARTGLGEATDRWGVPYWYVDTAFAAMVALLAAVDEGLGACFFGVPPVRIPAFREEFGVPERFRPVGCVSVGYPGDDDRRSPSLRRGRRPVEEVVHRGGW